MIAIAKLGTVFKWVWNSPIWVKAYVAIVLLPNLVLHCLLLYFFLVPWYEADVQAKIMTVKEKRDIQISQLIERQTKVNEVMNDNILRFERHQTLLMQAVLNSRQSSNSVTQ